MAAPPPPTPLASAPRRVWSSRAQRVPPPLTFPLTIGPSTAVPHRLLMFLFRSLRCTASSPPAILSISLTQVGSRPYRNILLIPRIRLGHVGCLSLQVTRASHALCCAQSDSSRSLTGGYFSLHHERELSVFRVWGPSATRNSDA